MSLALSHPNARSLRREIGGSASEAGSSAAYGYATLPRLLTLCLANHAPTFVQCNDAMMWRNTASGARSSRPSSGTRSQRESIRPECRPVPIPRRQIDPSLHSANKSTIVEPPSDATTSICTICLLRLVGGSAGLQSVLSPCTAVSAAVFVGNSPRQCLLPR